MEHESGRPPMKREVRKALRMERRIERITAHGRPQCRVCGEPDIRCLELHHPFGEANSDEKIVECANCHNKSSDAQQDWSPAWLARPGDGEQKPFGEVMAAFLAGIADLLELFCEEVVRWLRALADWMHENAASISGPQPPRLFPAAADSGS